MNYNTLFNKRLTNGKGLFEDLKDFIHSERHIQEQKNPKTDLYENLFETFLGYF